MKKTPKVFNSPIVKMLALGGIKALVLIPIGSFFLTAILMLQIYDVDFDKHIRPFGAASDFFVFGLGFISLWSIPVAFFAILILAFILRSDVRKERIGYKRSFWVGVVLGGVLGGGEALIMFSLLNATILTLYVMFFAGIIGGVGSLWMTRDAMKIYRGE